ncbi:unnamed protein product, partial [Mesorhabditis spiculigera]
MVKEDAITSGAPGDAAAGDAVDSSALEPEQFRKLFVGGLPVSTTAVALREYYGQWGNIVDAVVMQDRNSGRSRGFGFVAFEKSEDVDKAMNARPHEIEGKTIDPKRAVPRDESHRGQKLPSTNRLYVSGIREGHTEEMIKEYFTEFGQVEKVEILMDKATNKPRGFGFVNFDDYDAVDRCVLKKSHMINGFRCDCKKGLSKDELAGVGGQQGRDRAGRGDRFGGPPGGPRGYDDRGYGRPAPWDGPRGGGWGPGGGYGGGYGAPGGYDGGYGGGYGGYDDPYAGAGGGWAPPPPAAGRGGGAAGTGGRWPAAGGYGAPGYGGAPGGGYGAAGGQGGYGGGRGGGAAGAGGAGASWQ